MNIKFELMFRDEDVKICDRKKILIDEIVKNVNFFTIEKSTIKHLGADDLLSAVGYSPRLVTSISRRRN